MFITIHPLIFTHLVYFPNDTDVVPSDYVETQHHLKCRVCDQDLAISTPHYHLLHPLGPAVDPLVSLVEDQVYRLVEPLQCAHEVPPVRGDDRDRSADVALQGGGHVHWLFSLYFCQYLTFKSARKNSFYFYLVCTDINV